MSVQNQNITKKNILLVVNGDYSYCIRAKRIAEAYRSDGYNVFVLSHSASQQEENITEFFTFFSYASWFAKLRRFFKLLIRRYNSYLNEQGIAKRLIHQFELVICFDLICLPLVTTHIEYSKLIVDLREYYPKQFENDLVWNLTFGPLYTYLCKKYLCKADEHWTVSPGLKDTYKHYFNIDCLLKPGIPNIPKLPIKPIGNKIRLVHHGVANRNRNIEDMIKVVEMLPDNFYLDLYLVNNNNSYYNKIKALVAKNNRIELKPQIPQDLIVQTLSKYDLGLFICKPRTFNLAHAWPNKVFEFHKAGLRIVTTPLPGMLELKKQLPDIICSNSYELDSIVTTLRDLVTLNSD